MFCFVVIVVLLLIGTSEGFVRSSSISTLSAIGTMQRHSQSQKGRNQRNFNTAHQTKYDSLMTVKATQADGPTWGNGKYSAQMGRELNKFLDEAAREGSNIIDSMSLEQRVDLVMKGEQVENEIFDLMDKISFLGKTTAILII